MISARLRLIRTLAGLALFIGLLVGQPLLAGLVEHTSGPDAARLVQLGLFVAAAGLGIYAIHQGTRLVFRRLDRQAAIIWRNLVSWTLDVLLCLSIAGTLGFDLSGLLVGGAILGVVVAAAAQAPLGNFFAGLVLMVARPYRVGTTIRLRSSVVGGVEYEGTVVDQTALHTSLRIAGGEEVLRLPNTAVITSAMVTGRPPVQARMDLELPPHTRLGALQRSVEQDLRVSAGLVTVTPQKLQAGGDAKLLCQVEVRSTQPIEPRRLAEALACTLDDDEVLPARAM